MSGPAPARRVVVLTADTTHPAATNTISPLARPGTGLAPQLHADDAATLAALDLTDLACVVVVRPSPDSAELLDWVSRRAFNDNIAVVAGVIEAGMGPGVYTEHTLATGLGRTYVITVTDTSTGTLVRRGASPATPNLRQVSSGNPLAATVQAAYGTRAVGWASTDFTADPVLLVSRRDGQTPITLWGQLYPDTAALTAEGEQELLRLVTDAIDARNPYAPEVQVSSRARITVRQYTPSIDAFADAGLLDAGTTSYFGDSTGYTVEADEPAPPSGAGGRTAWLRWTPAPSYDGREVSFAAECSFPAILTAYATPAAANSGQPVGFAQLSLVATSLGPTQYPSYSPTVELLAQANTTYYLQLGVAYGGSGGAFILNHPDPGAPPEPDPAGLRAQLSASLALVASASVASVTLEAHLSATATMAAKLYVAPADFDSFARAQLLPAGTSTVSADVSDFTTEAGEPASAPERANRRSAWFRWSPGRSRHASTARVDTIGSNYNTVLAVWSASAPTTAFTDLTAVASDDQSGGANTSALEFVVDSALTYYFQVGEFRYAQAASALLVLNYPDPGAPDIVASASLSATATLAVRDALATGAGASLSAGAVLAVRSYALDVAVAASLSGIGMLLPGVLAPPDVPGARTSAALRGSAVLLDSKRLLPPPLLANNALTATLTRTGTLADPVELLAGTSSLFFHAPTAAPPQAAPPQSAPPQSAPPSTPAPVPEAGTVWLRWRPTASLHGRGASFELYRDAYKILRVYTADGPTPTGPEALTLLVAHDSAYSGGAHSAAGALPLVASVLVDSTLTYFLQVHGGYRTPGPGGIDEVNMVLAYTDPGFTPGAVTGVPAPTVTALPGPPGQRVVILSGRGLAGAVVSVHGGEAEPLLRTDVGPDGAWGAEPVFLGVGTHTLEVNQAVLIGPALTPSARVRVSVTVVPDPDADTGPDPDPDPDTGTDPSTAASGATVLYERIGAPPGRERAAAAVHLLGADYFSTQVPAGAAVLRRRRDGAPVRSVERWVRLSILGPVHTVQELMFWMPGLVLATGWDVRWGSTDTYTRPTNAVSTVATAAVPTTRPEVPNLAVGATLRGPGPLATPWLVLQASVSGDAAPGPLGGYGTDGRPHPLRLAIDWVQT